MSTLTIRNIDDDTKERLRVQAARHGRSMEEEVRIILKRSVGGPSGAQVWALSRELFSGAKGVDLPEVPRSKDRASPDLSANRHNGKRK